MLYDAINAEYSRVKNVPFSVKHESDVYRKHISRRINALRDVPSITDDQKQEIAELKRCIELIDARERDLYDSSIDY